MKLPFRPLDPRELDRRDVERALDGQKRAFDRLMRRHQKAVFQVSWSATGVRDDALDLSQDVFLAAFRNLESLREGERFRPWLLQIARRRGSNWRRARARHPVKDALPVEALEDRDLLPDQEPYQRGTEDDLAAALSALSDKGRRAVRLRYFEQRPIREIAQEFDTTEATVRNLLYRSLHRLRTALQPEETNR